jgi:SAM-dependent methyltransferase
LEVGCGTGAILTELLMQSHGEISGLDLSADHLALTARNLPGVSLTQGDAHVLPYLSHMFDIALCHYLLLWVDNPVKVVCEMARVTKPGGAVLALAEPDYGGRIDFPPELSALGEWQKTALRQQGADPLLGRKLRAIFQQAGLTHVEAGILGGQWSGLPTPEDWEKEWQVLQDDIENSSQSFEKKEFLNLKTLDRQAWQQGERVLFVPTFYTWGQVS